MTDDSLLSGSGSVLGKLGQAVPPYALYLIGGALTLPGTSAYPANQLLEEARVCEAEVTSNRPPSSVLDLDALLGRSDSVPTSALVHELRRESGLTWEKLAEVLRVTRRSVHFWASGKPLSANNEDHLARVLDVVRAGRRGHVRETKAALLAAVDGESVLDLLRQGRYPEARSQLGHGDAVATRQRQPLDAAAQKERQPLSPEVLGEARRDTVHREVGVSRAGRSVRNKPRDGE